MIASTAAPMLGAVARKRFGQHFLVDRAAVEAVVAAIDPREGDHLVEIGPGTAALTAPLLSRLGSLDAIEIDRDLAAALRRRWGERLRLHQQDVLEVDFGAIAQAAGGRIRVVGNLPYNISSPLLLHLTRFTGSIIDQHFMLQKEVVDRIVAEPGGDMGRLTVMLQAFYRVQTLFDVPARSLRSAAQGRVERDPDDPAPGAADPGRRRACKRCSRSPSRSAAR